MITPSSNRSPFGTYFLYKLRSQLKFLVVSLALNILALPIFSINTLISYKRQYESSLTPEIYLDNDIMLSAAGGLEVISAMAVFAIALIGAVSPFNYCLRSERTDTIGALPVTLKGRFWADFLSGYISRVAPIIPCSVFSMILSVPINGWFNKIVGADQGGIMIKAFLELNITFFISCTFAYVLSVLITVCCGKVSSSVSFTIISSIGLIVLSVIAGSFLVLCQTGTHRLNSLELMKYIPPLGTFLLKTKGVCDEINKISAIGNNRLPDPEDMILTNPSAYLIYALVIAAFIAAAYFAFKFRKPENTGHAVAVKKFYYAFSGVCAFMLICICCMILYRLHMWWLSALVSFAAAIIMLMIFALVRSRKRSELSKDFVRGSVVIVCCLAFLFVFDKTGAFGTRYHNISPEKTESLVISFRDFDSVSRNIESLTLTDKDDIRQFIDLTNKTLKKRSDELRYGNAFEVTYNLSSQKSIYRSYTNNYAVQSGEEMDAVDEMIENVRSLPNYPRYSSESTAERLSGDEIFVVMYDKFGKITIPKEHIGEFREILSREILEKYDKNAKEAGRVIVKHTDGVDGIPIRSNFTDTISFAESFRVYDGDAVAFTIKSYEDIVMTVEVKVKDVDNAGEKELFSLLEQRSTYNNYDGGSGFNITSENGLSYYVPEENKERVLELMMTILEKQFTQQSQ